MPSSIAVVQQVKNKRVYYKTVCTYPDPAVLTYIHPMPGIPVHIVCTLIGCGGKGGKGGTGGSYGGGGGKGGKAGDVLIVDYYALNNVSFGFDWRITPPTTAVLVDSATATTYSAYQGADGADGFNSESANSNGEDGEDGESSIFGKGGPKGLGAKGAHPATDGESSWLYGYGAGGGGGGGGSTTSTSGANGGPVYVGGGIIIFEIWDLN